MPVSPGESAPSALISTQSVWFGCGSDEISCTRVLLLVTVTRPPRAMVTAAGLTPLGPMVIVAVMGGVPPPPPPLPAGGGDGDVGPPSPLPQPGAGTAP